MHFNPSTVCLNKYRLLDHKIDNNLIPKIGIYFRIASFLNNIFGKRFHFYDDTFDEILQRMHNQKEVKNTLATEAEENVSLRRKLPFKSVTSDDILDFPEMTERDPKILLTGLYQLSQAVSYLTEMVNKYGKLKIQYVKNQSNVLKLKVSSHHISRTPYRCFLRYRPNSVIESDSDEDLKKYIHKKYAVLCEARGHTLKKHPVL